MYSVKIHVCQYSVLSDRILFILGW